METECDKQANKCDTYQKHKDDSKIDTNFFRLSKSKRIRHVVMINKCRDSVKLIIQLDQTNKAVIIVEPKEEGQEDVFLP